jgi:antirestriction protein ArdC
MVQYLQFRILEFPLISLSLYFGDQSELIKQALKISGDIREPRKGATRQHANRFVHRNLKN